MIARKEYYQKHYQKNKQHILQQHKRWREDNLDKTRAHHKKYNKEHHTEIAQRAQKYYQKNKHRWMQSDLRRWYEITPEEYNRLFVLQDGCCAICGTHQSELKRRLSIDHNHLTNEIRGLLCPECNWAIGKLQADKGIQLLIKAITYLLMGVE